MKYPPFSVVISTYHGEVAANLGTAIESIFEQTVPPDDVVLVVDGAVDSEQEELIKMLSLSHATLRVIWLRSNVGRGVARNIGIKEALHDIVALMDSDDISCADRFQQTLIAMQQRNADIVCSLQEEFDNSSFKVLCTKKCPEHDEAIKSSLKLTCIVSNPSIIFKKDIWHTVGGFPHFRNANEDYLFFLRAAKHNFVFYCVQRPLLRVRISSEQKRRRAGLNAFKDDIAFRMLCISEGHHSRAFALFALSLFLVKRLSPQYMRDAMNYIWRRRPI